MISFIYFDLGGVVLKDFSASNKWDLLRKDLGISDEDRDKFNNLWRNYEKEICTILPVYDMIPILEKEFHVTISRNHSILDNFVKYFEKNESIWPVIDEVKRYYRVGLLTSMYVGMLDEILKVDILPHVVWDRIIDSSIVGFAKPDKRIFEIAQKETQLNSESILFVENNRNNIDVAKTLGWKTFFYDSSDYDLSSKHLYDYVRQELKD